ncbi:hypothetical protein M885DRAFT_626279 [Pelagophyceae sp. CCMP2097]|nr:hypothetical protein M885DRAFT_626279 [Pelagophyceae sp. CCMP2097]
MYTANDRTMASFVKQSNGFYFGSLPAPSPGFTKIKNGLKDGFTVADYLEAKKNVAPTSFKDKCLYVEEAKPTSAPSSVPTPMPSTVMPSNVPSNAPSTPSPTVQPVKASLSAGLFFQTGLTPTAFLANEKARQAMIKSLAKTSGQAAANIKIKNAKLSARRRSLLAGELQIDYSITVILTGAKGAKVLALAQAQMTALALRIKTALADGSYFANLQSELVLDGFDITFFGTVDTALSEASALAGATTFAIAVDSPMPSSAPTATPTNAPTPIPSLTFSPTAKPTPAPTPVPVPTMPQPTSTASKKKKPTDNTTIIIIIVVVVGGGVILIGSAVAFMLARGRGHAVAKVNAETY